MKNGCESQATHTLVLLLIWFGFCSFFSTDRFHHVLKRSTLHNQRRNANAGAHRLSSCFKSCRQSLFDWPEEVDWSETWQKRATMKLSCCRRSCLMTLLVLLAARQVFGCERAPTDVMSLLNIFWHTHSDRVDLQGLLPNVGTSWSLYGILSNFGKKLF